MGIRDILSARRRSDNLPRALECDDNGALYTSGAGATQDVRVVDDADQSCMDNANDALRVNVVAGGAGGGAVTVADGADIAQGALGDAEVAGVGPASVIAILKRVRTLLASPLAVSAAAGAFVDGADIVQGLTTDAAVITDVAGTISGKLRGLVKWAFERMPAALGQQTMVLSLPVVLPSNQSDVPVLAGGPFTAVLGLEAIAATTMYQLIDLSDAANYPHTSTTAIILKRLRLHAEKATDGIFDIWVGVVIENDGTDGTAKWLHVFHLEAVGNPTDSTDRFAQELEFNLDLAVSEGVLVNYVTNQQLADSALLKNDVARTSPIGTANPGVGDLMVYVEEVTDGGTLDFVISADYDTR